jgi:hypothetical protein
MQRPLEPGTVSNTHFGYLHRSASSASGSALTALQSSGAYGAMLPLRHSGLFTMSRTQCNALISEYGGPLDTQGLKETRRQMNWQTLVPLKRNGTLALPQNQQSVVSAQSLGNNREKRRAPGGHGTVLNSLLGIRNGALTMQLSHYQSSTYLGPHSIDYWQYAQPTGTSPGITLSIAMPTPNSLALTGNPKPLSI